MTISLLLSRNHTEENIEHQIVPVEITDLLKSKEDYQTILSHPPT